MMFGSRTPRLPGGKLPGNRFALDRQRLLKRGDADPGRRPVIARRYRDCAGLVIVACTVFLPGCAAYQFGSASMFRPGIRTIHLPVVRNETFRHDLGVRLSEVLTREIELRTPYKVTADSNADSTLTCRVVSESKRVLTETDTDDPRALDAAVAVRATWTGRSGELLMQNSIVPTGDLAIRFSQDARFVPEAGQSIDSATQAAIEDLAQRIVSQMELRW